MTHLKIEFIPETEINARLNEQIDALDHLAFVGENHDDPEFANIQWSSHHWMALGWLDGELVSQACLLKREVSAGAERVWVAGVGGVATHPQWQRKGLASQLMRAATTFMRDEIRVPFGLLICADETRPLYEKTGWQFAADHLTFTQDRRRRALRTCVMVLQLDDPTWPSGEIDLCGLPW
jgi:GNAT superfamily N-acetyltransferase